MKGRAAGSGFSVIEIILAAGIFVIFATGITGVVISSFTGSRQGEEQTKATQFASEGLEAVRSVKNQAFANLTATASAGVTRFGGVWSLFGINNVFEKYTRTIAITTVQRDGSGNIVASGGTPDPLTWKATSTVSWAASPGRADSVILSTYLTDFRKRIARPGMLVYGDGGTATDAIKYQIINDSGDWFPATPAADIDAGSTNRVLQATRILASATRNEKIIVSRHYDGASQYIYAQVYNGSTWGNVQLLSNWAATTFLTVRNFDGTYLTDGTFMLVYSDNTNTPKMRTWNGTTWSAQSSLTSLGAAGQIPSFIRILARPGTNEVMAAFFTQALDAISEYWSGSAWSAITSHATNASNANNQEIDFAWSPNTTTIGAIIYMTAGGDNTPRVKLFSANGTGGGTWQAQVNGANLGAQIRTMVIKARSSANEFQSCYKDQQAAPDITCRKITFSGTTATWATPTNPILTASSVNNTNLAFDLGFEALTDNDAVNVYSDNTNVPKLKKYNASTSTWDATATSISTTPFTLGSPLQTVIVTPDPTNNDLMIVMADNSLGLYSVMWDGTNNAIYTTPAGRAFTQHGTSGSSVTNTWYDFSWDNF